MIFLRQIKKILLKKAYYFLRLYFAFPFASILVACKRSLKRKDKQILIIRTDHIGDFVLFSPAFRILKRKFPDYKLVFLGDMSIGSLIAKFPEIDEFIALDIKKFQFNLRYYLRIFSILRSRHFDQVIYPVYSRSFFGDELVRIAKADERIGFIGDNSNETEQQRIKANAFYTKLISSSRQLMSEIDRNKSFFIGWGVQMDDDFVPTISISEEEKTLIRTLLNNNGWKGNHYVMVNPGGSVPFNKWPRERFADVIRGLHSRGLDVVITGSKNEQVFFNEIQSKLDFPIINLVGKTSLIELAAVANQSVFYFGTDTGSMHIAAAAGTPAIGLIGGGTFSRFFPYGDLNRNRAVYDKNMKCKDDNWECAKINGYNKPAPCIDGISVESAIKEIDSLLGYLSKAKE